MRLPSFGSLLLAALLIAGCLLPGRDYRDPSGFRMDLPEGWLVKSYSGGIVTVNGPGPMVVVMPLLGRTGDCATSLRAKLAAGLAPFPGAAEVVIEPQSRGALARFRFLSGASQAVVLCAETSSRTAMLYGMSAPAGSFARHQPGMVAILRSFQFTGAPAAGAPPPMPRMTKWREPNEGAFTIPIPEGWNVQGGIQRLSNTDVRGGIRVWSADGASLIQFNDVRLEKVLVPGRQPLPPAPLGQGWRMGPHESGLQRAEWYLRQVWARELSLTGLEITARQDRRDLSTQADQIPLRMGVRGFQHLFGEVRFRATRQGRPVEGTLLGMTRMLWSPSPDLMGGNYETEIKGYLGPSGSGAILARIGGYMEGNCEYNYQWVAANRQAAQRDVQATLQQMRASADMQQRAFWDRMAAADRRAEGVGDLLSGRVRLTDGQGATYEAKAGSNYYFYDEQAGRTAGRRDDAVFGADLYPGLLVDLRPLEVVR